MALRFYGRVVLVTGAAKGIGRAIALAFAGEGARLCLLDIDSQFLEQTGDECRAKGVSCLTYNADVTDFGQVEQSIAGCLSEFSRIDVLVNNAGIITPSSPFEEIELDVWDRVFNVNLKGIIYCCRAVIPVMKNQRYGKIVNAASIYGLCPQVGRAPYSISKAGIIALTRVLAAELGPFGINVNAYAPGTIATDMAQEAIGSRSDEKLMQIPLGRFGQVEDVAQLVLFLSSDEASYITGATVLVDGGALSVHSPWRAQKTR